MRRRRGGFGPPQPPRIRAWAAAQAPSGSSANPASAWHFVNRVELADIRRERISLPLLRDERPELLVRELERIVAQRAGLAPDEPAEVPG